MFKRRIEGVYFIVVVEDDLGECAKKNLFTQEKISLLDDNKG
jgi:hypothetical protein